MADIIQLLPDSVANQIAAGEVIQRPASVVKELVENSVDAGSTVIKVIVREAGKNLVQVIDNGSGMSETDARLSFERHATSKIRNADDLFAIHSLGFRGEALASIAAIAEMEMQTRRQEDTVGTFVEINGARFVRQEPSNCRAGCNISVKNLFFNVPARRKFLKANSTELRHIIQEFQRIALARPDIEFSLYNDTTPVFHLPPANSRQRIIHIFGKNINQQLVQVSTQTTLAGISGFIAKPGYAKRSTGEQFFFVNKRFMRHPYFHKAVTRAYEKLIPADSLPAYFIYFEADPQSVDVNIHPTKTEIKFENEKAIWQILLASVRESLGKFNLVPSIDFNTDGMIDIPVGRREGDPVPPRITVDPDFNPFDREKGAYTKSRDYDSRKGRFGEWEKLYSDFESGRGSTLPGDEGEAALPGSEADTGRDNQTEREGSGGETGHQTESRTGEEGKPVTSPSFLQIKNRYILTPVKSGLMIIDQKRAHERILYEKFMKTIRSGSIAAQQQLYPLNLQLSPPDYLLIKEMAAELADFGFDIRDFGPNSILVSGCPADMADADPGEIIERLLDGYRSSGSVHNESPRERISRILARSSAVNYGKTLSTEEMQEIIDRLFACEIPNYSPDGKTVITILGNDELDRKFRHK